MLQNSLNVSSISTTLTCLKITKLFKTAVSTLANLRDFNISPILIGMQVGICGSLVRPTFIFKILFVSLFIFFVFVLRPLKKKLFVHKPRKKLKRKGKLQMPRERPPRKQSRKKLNWK